MTVSWRRRRDRTDTIVEAIRYLSLSPAVNAASAGVDQGLRLLTRISGADTVRLWAWQAGSAALAAVTDGATGTAAEPLLDLNRLLHLSDLPLDDPLPRLSRGLTVTAPSGQTPNSGGLALIGICARDRLWGALSLTGGTVPRWSRRELRALEAAAQAFGGRIAAQMAEADLLDDERRFREVLEAVGRISVQGYDHHRRVIYWNAGSERLYGYTRDEALGRKLEDLIIPNGMRERVIADVEHWLSSGIPPEAKELRLQRKDKRLTPVFSSHVIKHDRAGQPEMYCVDIDLSREKQIEETLRAALERARQASRTKTAFLAHMSHELRTPLNAVIGFAEVLTQEMMGPIGDTRYRGYARDILEAGQQLLQQIEQVLTYSKLQMGAFKETELDVALTVEQASLLVDAMHQIEDRTMALQVMLPPDLPHLRADAQLVRQILVNVIGKAANAVEAPVRVGAGLAEDGALDILVRQDTQAWVPDPILRDPFHDHDRDPFVRDTTRDVDFALPLAKALMEAHGGDLLVNNPAGTEVRLRFPADRVGHIATGPVTKEPVTKRPGTKESIR